MMAGRKNNSGVSEELSHRFYRERTEQELLDAVGILEQQNSNRHASPASLACLFACRRELFRRTYRWFFESGVTHENRSRGRGD
jgi:hypothetical protein